MPPRVHLYQSPHDHQNPSESVPTWSKFANERPERTHGESERTHERPERTHEHPERTHEDPERTHEDPEQTHGDPEQTRRSSERTRQRSLQSVTEWRRSQRCQPLSWIRGKLSQKLLGYWNHYGVIGNWKSPADCQPSRAPSPHLSEFRRVTSRAGGRLSAFRPPQNPPRASPTGREY
jgi:hypothetical protein